MPGAADSQGPLILLRPLNKDKRVLQQADGLYHGLHVPASLPTFMTDFVRELGKPFIVDPTTYIFMLRPKRVLDPKKGVTRPGVAELAEKYGWPFQDAVGRRALTGDDFPEGSSSTDEAVRRVLQHQKAKFSGQMLLPLDPYYAKYTLDGARLQADAAPSLNSPSFLVPPYFPFRRVGDPWYALSLRLADRALALKEEGDRIAPIVLLAREVLGDHAQVAQILSDYGGRAFDGALVWVNDFHEEWEPKARLQGLMTLVQGLAGMGRPVFKLFGGYFSVLLFAKGLNGFSCGLGYGSSKNAYAYGGGGGKSNPKFYVQRLHRSLELGDAERLLRAYPDLRCACKICRNVYGTDMNKFPEMMKPGRCQSHFLNARRAETRTFLADGLEKCLRDMEPTIKAHKDNLLVDVKPLQVWSEVLSGA